MLAWVRSALQATAWSETDLTLRFWAGPRSWYCSWPLGTALEDTCAVPPKLARSPSSAMNHPPLMLTLHSGVLAGRTQVTVASSEGSPESWVPLLLVSANAWTASPPGKVGPA